MLQATMCSPEALGILRGIRNMWWRRLTQRACLDRHNQHATLVVIRYFLQRSLAEAVRHVPRIFNKGFNHCWRTRLDMRTFGIANVFAFERVLQRWYESRKIDLETCKDCIESSLHSTYKYDNFVILRVLRQSL